MLKHPDPAEFARAILLEASDIPADMTIAQWRRQKQDAARRDRRPRRLPRPRRERTARAAWRPSDARVIRSPAARAARVRPV
jgi:hypothetical protein